MNGVQCHPVDVPNEDYNDIENKKETYLSVG